MQMILGLRISPFMQQCVKQTPRNGGKLKCQYRANPGNEPGECVTTRRGASLIGMMV